MPDIRHRVVISAPLDRVYEAVATADDGLRASVDRLAPRVSVERLFDLGPGAFQPPPRVWSAVARLTFLTTPRFAVSPHYAEVVAAAFAHRRKTLRNAIARLLSGAEIAACGLDPGARPQTLTPQEFNILALALDRTPLPG